MRDVGVEVVEKGHVEGIKEALDQGLFLVAYEIFDRFREFFEMNEYTDITVEQLI